MEKRDAVCGMELSGVSSGIVSSVYHGKTFLFCSDYCRARFLRSPEKFFGIPLVALRDVWKVFDLGAVKVEALRGLNLNIWAGDFTAIVGASGSGKSTALHLIGLLDRPTSGHVLLNGRDTAMLPDDEKSLLRSKTFGFVFQQYNLIPWLTAFDNVALPFVFSGKPVDSHAVEERFRAVGLAERMRHRPFELSGGEQQRVSLARALANDPAVILADEPTGNLDSATGNSILALLRKLQREEKKTLVVITHDRDIAAEADHVIVMRDGMLIQNHHIQLQRLTE